MSARLWVPSNVTTRSGFQNFQQNKFFTVFDPQQPEAGLPNHFAFVVSDKRSLEGVRVAVVERDVVETRDHHLLGPVVQVRARANLEHKGDTNSRFPVFNKIHTNSDSRAEDV